VNVREYIEARAKSDAAFAKLIAAIKELERRMADRAAETIAGFDTAGGVLIASDANIEQSLRVIAAMKGELAGDPWIDAVSDYLESFDETADRLLDYGQTLGEVDPGPVIGIGRNYKSLLADLLTSPSTYAATLWIPAYQSLSGIVASEATVASAINAVTTLAVGDDEVLGKVESEVSRPVGDAQSVHERATTQAIAKQLDIQFYLYQGSAIDTTREFCRERRDKVWHIKEIEGWASLEWSGKKPETNRGNILELLGGYECRHIAVPLAKRDVPAADLQRMKAKGYI